MNNSLNTEEKIFFDLPKLFDDDSENIFPNLLAKVSSDINEMSDLMGGGNNFPEYIDLPELFRQENSHVQTVDLLNLMDLINKNHNNNTLSELTINKFSDLNGGKHKINKIKGVRILKSHI